MNSRLFGFIVALLILFALSNRVFAQDDPPPPPLPTHFTPAATGIVDPAAHTSPITGTGQDVTPPPPLPTKASPTPLSSASGSPTITNIQVTHRVNGQFKATRKLYHGETARFLISFRSDRGSAAAASARLVIFKNAKELLSQAMRKGGMTTNTGSFHSDVHLGAKSQVGKLKAFFTVTLGRSTQRSLSFSVIPKPATKG